MRLTVYAVGILAMAAFLAVAKSGAENRSALSKQTHDNLFTAMRGEAVAYAKYMLYAQHARANGKKQLAVLFEKAARDERLQHFSEEADLAGIIGSDEDNLREAIKGESYEAETMYRKFALQAAAAGDTAAANRFDEIRHDEMTHRDAFKAALARPEIMGVGVH